MENKNLLQLGNIQLPTLVVLSEPLLMLAVAAVDVDVDVALHIHTQNTNELQSFEGIIS